MIVISGGSIGLIPKNRERILILFCKLSKLNTFKTITMKKIILAVFLIAGAASLHAQDSSKHKMQHKKMSSDSSHKSWNKSDTSMHHNKMKGGKMKKDSSK